MPLAALYLPKKFRHSQPKLYQQLIRNTNRLTSTFDLHETLKELAQLRVSNKPTPITNNAKQTKQIGRSLFTEIPLDRECTDAKIPENFCVCMEEPEDNMDTAHLEVSPFALMYINVMLCMLIVFNYRQKCSSTFVNTLIESSLH